MEGKMAKIAVFGDIHSNATAYSKVLDHAGECDAWWCVGDVIGYGPDPNKCIEVIRSIDCEVVAGNHDLGAVGKISIASFNDDARMACDWTSGILTDENKAFLNGLETTVTPEKGILLSHGGPVDPVWSYIFSIEEAYLNFMSFDCWICFHGHSHVPMVFKMKNNESEKIRPADLELVSPGDGDTFELEDEYRYLVNVGSVGQPRDNDHRSCYVIFEPEERRLTYHRVEYPVDEVQERMAFAGLPRGLISRLAFGR